MDNDKHVECLHGDNIMGLHSNRNECVMFLKNILTNEKNVSI